MVPAAIAGRIPLQASSGEPAETVGVGGNPHSAGAVLVQDAGRHGAELTEVSRRGDELTVLNYIDADVRACPYPALPVFDQRLD